MYLQPKKTSATSEVPVFQIVHETAQGGFTLDTSNLIIGDVIPAASVVSLNEATRIGTIIQTATMADVATNSALTYRIKKTHILKVGQNIARIVGGPAYPITAINTTNTAYDTITVGTTLGVALTTGDALFVSSATGATAAIHPVTHGLLYQDETVQVGAPISVAIRATVYERRMPGAVSSMKSQQPNNIFSQSF